MCRLSALFIWILIHLFVSEKGNLHGITFFIMKQIHQLRNILQVFTCTLKHYYSCLCTPWKVFKLPYMRQCNYSLKL